MILYHGGYEEVWEPRVIQSEIGRDFGFAFYTTDIPVSYTHLTLPTT